MMPRLNTVLFGPFVSIRFIPTASITFLIDTPRAGAEHIARVSRLVRAAAREHAVSAVVCVWPGG